MENLGFPIAAFEHEHEFPAITKNSKNFRKPLAENSDVSVVIGLPGSSSAVTKRLAC
jgi:hypothetical protein